MSAKTVAPGDARDVLGTSTAWFAYVAYGMTMAALVLANPKPHGAEHVFGIVGAIALWRYSWWLTHVSRAAYYLKIRFPKLRAAADETANKPERIYALVMSYRVPPKEFVAVYEAIIRSAQDYGVPITIVASVTRDRDMSLLRALYEAAGSPKDVEIISQFQKGDGKRSAMGMALRAIRRKLPSDSTPVIFMDGDIVIPVDTIRKTVSVMASNPGIGAVTTNNAAFVTGNLPVREWYRVRYAQRNMLMASLSVSERLLVLTGRFSVFRAGLATDPEMIEMVESDGIPHWRHGWLRFVSGDDKSTWHFAMSRGARMLYIPDVFVHGLEALPEGQGFFSGTNSLMRRWFGNMLRTNARALALGPRKLGLFTWYSLLDQRLSIWTSMIGPTAMVLLSIFLSPIYLAYYLLWIFVTRTVMSTAIGIAYRGFSPLWPALIYYNQIWGAFLKGYIWFRLDVQGWTRQKVGTASSRGTLNIWATRGLHAASMALFAYGVGLLTGVLDVPAVADWAIVYREIVGV